MICTTCGLSIVCKAEKGVFFWNHGQENPRTAFGTPHIGTLIVCMDHLFVYVRRVNLAKHVAREI